MEVPVVAIVANDKSYPDALTEVMNQASGRSGIIDFSCRSFTSHATTHDSRSRQNPSRFLAGLTMSTGRSTCQSLLLAAIEPPENWRYAAIRHSQVVSSVRRWVRTSLPTATSQKPKELPMPTAPC